MSYTERDIEMFLEGMEWARSIGTETNKGVVAGRAVTQEHTTLSLLKEHCAKKGVFNGEYNQPSEIYASER